MWGTCESIVFPLVIFPLRSTEHVPVFRESATTLEAESGYIMETPEVAEFRRCILNASWDSAEAALMRLSVTENDGLWVSLVNGLTVTARPDVLW